MGPAICSSTGTAPGALGLSARHGRVAITSRAAAAASPKCRLFAPDPITPPDDPFASLQHFTELVLQHSRDPLEEDLAALSDLYSLLVTLYRHCPDILTGVIPLLEEQIRGDNPHLREQATIALGQMFGALPAANAMGSAAGTQWAMLAGPQRSTWKAWLGRRIDKSVAIRLAWVAGAKDVLVNHQDMREDIEGE